MSDTSWRAFFIYGSTFPGVTAQDLVSGLKGTYRKRGGRNHCKFLKGLENGKGEILGNRILDICEERRIHCVSFLHPSYPEALRLPGSSPPVLFYRGDITLLTKLSGAVIGSRKPTVQGLQFCSRISTDLARYEVVVVSGFARGIDSCAHRSALKGGGTTVAVLGSGLDIVYPPENEDLYREIDERGCIISRFPPGTKPFRSNFPIRNMIIAAISEFTAVIEAAGRSGSLITARHALEMGKDVFSVPGSPLYPQSEGVNTLIKNGATPLTSIDDIVQNFGFSTENKKRGRSGKPTVSEKNLAEPEKKVYEHVRGAVTIDDLVATTGLNVKVVTSSLLTLELTGHLTRGDDGYYFRKA
jgi:DNA processing protein